MNPLQLEVLAQHTLRHKLRREAAHMRLVKAVRGQSQAVLAVAA
jgi:hypothetical protein